jgi:hypothetical protein
MQQLTYRKIARRRAGGKRISIQKAMGDAREESPQPPDVKQQSQENQPL